MIDNLLRDNERAQAAGEYAAVVMGNLARRFPYSAHHTQDTGEDRPTPEQIHPAFYSSFDWHSCVHMHWLGVSLLGFASGDGGSEGGGDVTAVAGSRTEDGGRPWLDADTANALRQALAANLTADNLAVEAAYLLENASWERPYGWAWLMRLAASCSASEDDQIRGWGTALAPTVDAVAGLAIAWLDKAQYPVRHGLHTNSAFGVAYLLDAFRSLGRTEAAEACEAAARRWFLKDTGWAADWELSGQDFLSAGLSEADLMRRILDPADFARWFQAFLPELGAESRILTPVSVSDESDGYLVHLHGLNLTRAGQLARILHTLHQAGSATAVEAVLSGALDPLLRAGLLGLQSGDFMSSHWLASFAWDALESTAPLPMQRD